MCALTKEPHKMREPYPGWFNKKAKEFVLQPFDPQKSKSRALARPGAWVRIVRCFDGTFQVDWQITPDLQCWRVNGSVPFTEKQFINAFGLSSDPKKQTPRAPGSSGGKSFVDGIYVRYLDYLNIPFAGTGMNGDLNISIHLTKDLKDALRPLLKAVPA